MNKKASTYVIISRIDEAVFEGDVSSVIVPGSEGVLTILPEHEPFISTLSAGTIHVETSKGTHAIEIEKGLLEVSDDQVSILI